MILSRIRLECRYTGPTYSAAARTALCIEARSQGARMTNVGRLPTIECLTLLKKGLLYHQDTKSQRTLIVRPADVDRASEGFLRFDVTTQA